ncbi:MAG: LamG domain-containing protein [Asgard group archaeon]|nr:LamG domain-containing protein [Asgard group archaeon]
MIKRSQIYALLIMTLLVYTDIVQLNAFRNFDDEEIDKGFDFDFLDNLFKKDKESEKNIPIHNDYDYDDNIYEDILERIMDFYEILADLSDYDEIIPKEGTWDDIIKDYLNDKITFEDFIVSIRGSELITYDNITIDGTDYVETTTELLLELPAVNLTDAISSLIYGKQITDYSILKITDIYNETKDYYLDQLVSYTKYLIENGLIEDNYDNLEDLREDLDIYISQPDAKIVTINYNINQTTNSVANEIISFALYLEDTDELIYDTYAFNIPKIQFEEQTTIVEWSNSITDYVYCYSVNKYTWRATYNRWNKDIPIATFNVVNEFVIDMSGDKNIPFHEIISGETTSYDNLGSILLPSSFGWRYPQLGTTFSVKLHDCPFEDNERRKVSWFETKQNEAIASKLDTSIELTTISTTDDLVDNGLANIVPFTIPLTFLDTKSFFIKQSSTSKDVALPHSEANLCLNKLTITKNNDKSDIYGKLDFDFTSRFSVSITDSKGKIQSYNGQTIAKSLGQKITYIREPQVPSYVYYFDSEKLTYGIENPLTIEFTPFEIGKSFAYYAEITVYGQYNDIGEFDEIAHLDEEILTKDDEDHYTKTLNILPTEIGNLRINIDIDFRIEALTSSRAITGEVLSMPYFREVTDTFEVLSDPPDINVPISDQAFVLLLQFNEEEIDDICNPYFSNQQIFRIELTNFGASDAYDCVLIIKYQRNLGEWGTLCEFYPGFENNVIAIGSTKTYTEIVFEDSVPDNERILRLIGDYELRYYIYYKFDDDNDVTHENTQRLDVINGVQDPENDPYNSFTVGYLNDLEVDITIDKTDDNFWLKYDLGNYGVNTVLSYNLKMKINNFDLIFTGLKDLFGGFVNIFLPTIAGTVGDLTKGSVAWIIAALTEGGSYFTKLSGGSDLFTNLIDYTIKTVYYGIIYGIYRGERLVDEVTNPEPITIFDLSGTNIIDENVGPFPPNDYIASVDDYCETFCNIIKLLGKDKEWATKTILGDKYFGYNKIKANDLDIEFTIKDQYENPVVAIIDWDVWEKSAEGVDSCIYQGRTRNINSLEDIIIFEVRPTGLAADRYKSSIDAKMLAESCLYAVVFEWIIGSVLTIVASILVFSSCGAAAPLAEFLMKFAFHLALKIIQNLVTAGITAIISFTQAQLAMKDPDYNYFEIAKPIPFDIFIPQAYTANESKLRTEAIYLSELYGFIAAARITRFRLEAAINESAYDYIELQANALNNYSKEIRLLARKYITQASVIEFGDEYADELVDLLPQMIDSNIPVEYKDSTTSLPLPETDNPYFEEDGTIYPSDSELINSANNEINETYLLSSNDASFFEKVVNFLEINHFAIEMENASAVGFAFYRTQGSNELIADVTYDRMYNLSNPLSLASLNLTMYNTIENYDLDFENTVNNFRSAIWSYFYETNNTDCFVFLEDVYNGELVISAIHASQLVVYPTPLVIRPNEIDSEVFNLEIRNCGLINTTFKLELIDYSVNLTTNLTTPIYEYITNGTTKLYTIEILNHEELLEGEYYLTYKLSSVDNEEFNNIYNQTIRISQINFGGYFQQSSISILPGELGIIYFNLSNIGLISDNYIFNITQINNDWISYQQLGTLEAGKSLLYPLNIYVPKKYTNSDGVNYFILTVISIADPSLVKEYVFSIEVLPFSEFTFDINIVKNNVFTNEIAKISLTVYNLGNAPDYFTISLDADQNKWLYANITTPTINPGESYTVIIELTPKANEELEGQKYGFGIYITSQDDSLVNLTLPLVVEVLEYQEIILQEDGTGSVSWVPSAANYKTTSGSIEGYYLINNGVNDYGTTQLLISPFLDLSNWNGNTMLKVRFNFRTASNYNSTHFILTFIDSYGYIIPMYAPISTAYYNSSAVHHPGQIWLSDEDSGWLTVILDVTQVLQQFVGTNDQVRIAWGHYDPWGNDDQEKDYLRDLVVYDTGSLADWWDTDWTYRREIIIDNFSGDSQFDYQLPINLDNFIYDQEGLVGSWHLNGGLCATVIDLSGNDNFGTIYGTPNWIPGIEGSCIDFDGDDYIYISEDDSLDLSSGTFSISLWIKPDEVVGYRSIIGHQAVDEEPKDRYPCLYLNDVNSTTGNIHFGFGDGVNWVSNTAYNVLNRGAGHWYYIVYTLDSVTDTEKLFVNGELVFSGAEAHTPVNKKELYIGKCSTIYQGLIDEVRIYNRPLSVEEIEIYFDIGVNRLLTNANINLGIEYPQQGYAGSWYFNENEGTVAYDKLGISNGIITGSTWTSEGVDGSALYFDGENDHVEISPNDAINSEDAITVSLWVKPLSGSFYQMYVTKDYANQWAIGKTNGANTFRWYIKTIGSGWQFVNEYSFTNGQWYFLTMTYDSSSGSWNRYVNGELVGSTM